MKIIDSLIGTSPAKMFVEDKGKGVLFISVVDRSNLTRIAIHIEDLENALKQIKTVYTLRQTRGHDVSKHGNGIGCEWTLYKHGHSIKTYDEYTIGILECDRLNRNKL